MPGLRLVEFNPSYSVSNIVISHFLFNKVSSFVVVDVRKHNRCSGYELHSLRVIAKDKLTPRKSKETPHFKFNVEYFDHLVVQH